MLGFLDKEYSFRTRSISMKCTDLPVPKPSGRFPDFRRMYFLFLFQKNLVCNLTTYSSLFVPGGNGMVTKEERGHVVVLDEVGA